MSSLPITDLENKIQSRLIGLTGAIGAGKSLVASVWQDRGAAVVEGDAMGRLALETDSYLQKSLTARFGAQILGNSGMIDRARLARSAFADQASQRDLTSLTFPTLYRLAQDEFSVLAQSHNIVVFDAALIYEWGIEDDFSTVVVVDDSEESLIARAAERLGVPRETAKARLQFQMPPADKAARADYVIHNDSDVDALRARAVKLWNEISKRYGNEQGRNKYR